jgi:hypothetical protein
VSHRKGFTLAVLDTAGVDNPAAHLTMQAADLCLMPARPSRLDIEATGSTFRAVIRMGCRVAFLLNQCPPGRTTSRAAGLRMLGVLADPTMTALLSQRPEHHIARVEGRYPPAGVLPSCRQPKGADIHQPEEEKFGVVYAKRKRILAASLVQRDAAAEPVIKKEHKKR